MEAVHTDSPILKTAQAQFQQKKYDLCLLTLHTLSQAGGADEADAQALAAMCKIHKHAALQEWHKVASNATLMSCHLHTMRTEAGFMGRQ